MVICEKIYLFLYLFSSDYNTFILISLPNPTKPNR